MWAACDFYDWDDYVGIRQYDLLQALAAGADVHEVREGDTILHCICRQFEYHSGDQAEDTPAGLLRRALAWFDVDVHERRQFSSQETAMHLAAAQGVVENMGVLLAHGADVHAVDDAGFTSVHYA